MKKLVFGLVSLCLVACSDGSGNGEEDPCESVECSGFGDCVVESGAAVCQCDSGYHAEGLECVEDQQDPCQGVDCSGFGECVVQSGSAVCQCDAGYRPEGLECVPDPVDCADADLLCVDDTPGAQQEYATIQAAADAVQAGQTILVFDGNYAGFDLTTGGSETARVVIRAEGDGAVIDSDGPDGYGIWLRNTSYVTIQGFSIVGVSGRGVAHREATPEQPSRSLIIRGNTVQNSGREGMYLSEVADSLIEGNRISGSGTSGADRTHGIYLANAGSDGTTIRANHIWGSGTAGIHFNGDLSVGGDGIISDLIVENNIIHDNQQNGLNMDGVQDSLIRNNLIYGNASNGLRAYAIDAAEGPKNLVVVNNTFHAPAGAGWCVRITEDLGGNVVFNNILMNDHDWKGSIALDGTSGFASGYNAVVDSFTPDRDSTLLDLAGWQGLGYGSGSFLAAPGELFEDPGSGNYKLKAGCDAEGAGTAGFEGHTAPATDLEGAQRSGTPDVGAYER